MSIVIALIAFAMGFGAGFALRRRASNPDRYKAEGVSILVAKGWNVAGALAAADYRHRIWRDRHCRELQAAILENAAHWREEWKLLGYDNT